MWAIKKPDGTIDQNYVGCTKDYVWYERGWYLMVETFGPAWEKKFWKRLKPSIADFRKKGYSIVKVKVVLWKK